MTDKSTFVYRIRAAKPCTKNYDLWDDVISGLGVRFATLGNADTLTLPERREGKPASCSLPLSTRPGMNPDGTDPQRLPNTDTGDGAPSWSSF